MGGRHRTPTRVVMLLLLLGTVGVGRGGAVPALTKVGHLGLPEGGTTLVCAVGIQRGQCIFFWLVLGFRIDGFTKGYLLKKESKTRFLLSANACAFLRPSRSLR